MRFRNLKDKNNVFTTEEDYLRGPLFVKEELLYFITLEKDDDFENENKGLDENVFIVGLFKSENLDVILGGLTICPYVELY